MQVPVGFLHKIPAKMYNHNNVRLNASIGNMNALETLNERNIMEFTFGLRKQTLTTQLKVSQE